MNKMTHEQFLLMKLAEEATEIAQIALKTAQFGMTEKHPDMPLNNLERIHLELNDLHAVVDELNTWCQFGFKPNHAAKINKIEKLNKYLGYSIQLGKVENVPAIFGESESQTTQNTWVHSVTLTCAELKEACDFGAPDETEEQLADLVTIGWHENGHSGSGYYACMAECEAEGSIKLGKSESGAEG
ncbi:hypothetical protein [Acinetobacter pittii]|uniref:hypothetical protein n=1 Tax=Acinetobacter pittii TaxID=48296 RepID=UPI000AD7F705|nr:hypothetical protein [Acinetobacter pittii]